jgi:hypothetical protein
MNNEEIKNSRKIVWGKRKFATNLKCSEKSLQVTNNNDNDSDINRLSKTFLNEQGVF